MIEKVVRQIVKESTKRLGIYSEDATDLIMATGRTESKFKYLKQIRGPALGFFQMEPATCRDIWENYVIYRPSYKSGLMKLGFDDALINKAVKHNQKAILQFRVRFADYIIEGFQRNFQKQEI